MKLGARHVWLAALALSLAGCGDSGEHAPEETSSPALPPITVTSSAFTAGQPIPQRYACEDRGGQNLSPPLAWAGAPTATVSIAVVVTDPDADNFIHWVLVDVPPQVMSLTEAQVPAGVRKVQEWFGPCPPSGVHDYVFAVYALNRRIPADVTEPPAAITAVREAAIAKGQLTGTFAK